MFKSVGLHNVPHPLTKQLDMWALQHPAALLSSTAGLHVERINKHSCDKQNEPTPTHQFQ